ncbi:hypothetical protein [Bradyrhizobium glycinis]|uniref:hypothetical protein n=1 Tax=Bradyrhizobium glycinis TaxID=2751812 RepID=UPI0018D7E084|nr:hypothetical protein [Bradyrhizobium glycinis]MBH5371551.1 hypothetical protein [Bradyrhizobium glycinis]
MSIAAATPSRTATLLSEILEADEAFGRQLIEFLDSKIRTDGRDGAGSYPLRFSTVARSILYLGLALHEKKRKGLPKKLQPQWQDVLDLYADFHARNPKLNMLPVTITDDDLLGLCDLSTRRRGSQKKHFYAAIVLFYVDLLEEGGLTESDLRFVAMATPEGERDFQVRIADLVRIASVSRALPTQKDQLAKRHEYPIVNVGYTYHRSLHEEFRSFVDHFASALDGNAHFICYRPRNEWPNQLVKSFLAIRPPVPGRDHFSFVHVYRMPCKGDQKRISIGAVLPLENGVCLVGGQRHLAPKKERTVPFTNLKIVVLPWTAVKVRERVFGGLVMSADYLGTNLVSRIGLRCTPVHHSDEMQLDAIPATSLEQDIAGDARIERELAGADYGRFEIEAKDAARRIAELANNAPADWESPPGFFELNRQQAITKTPLHKHLIEEAIADRFGTDEHPKFQTREGVNFQFWKDLRFGPITSE